MSYRNSGSFDFLFHTPTGIADNIVRLLHLTEGGLAARAVHTSALPFNVDVREATESAHKVARIIIPLPGYTQDEVTVETRDARLYITAAPAEALKAPADFERTIERVSNSPVQAVFQLGAFARVEDAVLQNGLLTINLVDEVPEARRPQRFDLNKSA